MIIGKGLLANSLRRIDSPDVNIFCSGVSDSLENNSVQFQREIDLLSQQNKALKILYFSTTSVFNPSKANSPYIKHKLNIENFIEDNYPDYIIIRLPNIVGNGGNKNNLFPYLYQTILNGGPVKIFKHAVRHLMSANDLPEIVNMLIKSDFNGKINVCYDSPPLVIDIYLFMCTALHKTPNYELILDSEKLYEIDNSSFKELIKINHLHVVSDWKVIVNNFITELLNSRNHS
jgi:nucleoside-diphosphate-sugar epimerase